MKTITVHVTQDHINRGKPHSPGSCPVALACQEQVSPNIRVGLIQFKGISIHDNSTLYVACVDTPASNFVKRFDAGLTVEPFSFELEVP